MQTPVLLRSGKKPVPSPEVLPAVLSVDLSAALRLAPQSMEPSDRSLLLRHPVELPAVLLGLVEEISAVQRSQSLQLSAPLLLAAHYLPQLQVAQSTELLPESVHWSPSQAEARGRGQGSMRFRIH